MIDRATAKALICARHYTHSFPSGKSEVFEFDDVVVVFSIPANRHISRFLLGKPNVVWELSRLWAEDGHPPNALTQAISRGTGAFRKLYPDVEALVSYADPNVGHTGGVYRAASWTFLGSCEETRAYRGPGGEIVSRRAFHSGKHALRKDEILAKGFVQLKLPGKLRFARGLTHSARKTLARKAV